MVTQLKAFLEATQQMAAYVPYYALVASPLHALTKKDRAFPTGSKWIICKDFCALMQVNNVHRTKRIK